VLLSVPGIPFERVGCADLDAEPGCDIPWGIGYGPKKFGLVAMYEQVNTDFKVTSSGGVK
jgi:hypothetical protein